MSAPYLIGRVIDPLYAVFIGAGAAAVRIRREEKEKGRNTSESVESLKQRVQMLFEKETGTASGRAKAS
ncbi:hypothetical protein LTR56_000457 [Elasticomyces elasticus]|nr:hypothetical protein LTR22_014185 [Elasticomyces elasticus]KAK3660699.1 hypothetical protein LTR56_000457 [Elasticomyces elasticus]KAK4922845.1 hypothetical protein LTR49_009852 [Elasticomyces elasticus]KAK5759778.1 hypothetical protein LTS12_010118 [Elasticomyces elasticus]